MSYEIRGGDVYGEPGLVLNPGDKSRLDKERIGAAHNQAMQEQHDNAVLENAARIYRERQASDDAARVALEKRDAATLQNAAELYGKEQKTAHIKEMHEKGMTEQSYEDMMASAVNLAKKQLLNEAREYAKAHPDTRPIHEQIPGEISLPDVGTEVLNNQFSKEIAAARDADGRLNTAKLNQDRLVRYRKALNPLVGETTEAFNARMEDVFGKGYNPGDVMDVMDPGDLWRVRDIGERQGEGVNPLADMILGYEKIKEEAALKESLGEAALSTTVDGPEAE